MSKYRHRYYRHKKQMIRFYSLAIFIIIASDGAIIYNSGYLFQVLIITGIIAAVTLIAYLMYCSMKNDAKDRRYLNSGIDVVDKMTGEEFENFLQAHFKNLGYQVKTTPKTGDYGTDLILNKESERIVVQAKRWVNKVGVEAVQQIIGAKSYYKADKCMVITNNYFSPNAKELAGRSGIELWDRKKLIEIMRMSDGVKAAGEVSNPSEVRKRVICNKCGAEMVLRHGKNRDFYGCSRYPKCRNTMDNFGKW